MPNITIKDGNGANQVLATALTNDELRAAAVAVTVNTAPRATQTDPVAAKITLVAATAATALAANANAVGCRVLNWTASPVYIAQGVAGTPDSGAPSDYIPAAASGVPGQWEAPYRPTTGLRVVGASAGDLSVLSW